MQLSSFFHLINSDAIIDDKSSINIQNVLFAYLQVISIRRITSMINLTPTSGVVGISFIQAAPCYSSAKNLMPFLSVSTILNFNYRTRLLSNPFS